MNYQLTPTMSGLDAMFDSLFGPKLLPEIEAPVLPELSESEIAEGDLTADRR